MAWAKCTPCKLVQYWQSSSRSGLEKWCCSQCGEYLEEVSAPDYAVGDKHRILPARGICPRAVERWVYNAQADNPDWKKRMRGDIERHISHLLASGWSEADAPYFYIPADGTEATPLSEAIIQQETLERQTRIRQSASA